MKLVMVGNGMAGARTLEELIALAPELFEITVFGAEPHANYNRILLSPVLAGEAYVPSFLAHWLDEATRAFAADVSPYATPLPLRTGTRWLRPKLVAIVEHAGEQGILRDARFRALRLDGRLDDCRPEEPVEIESEPATSGTERPRLVLLQSLRLDQG